MNKSVIDRKPGMTLFLCISICFFVVAPVTASIDQLTLSLDFSDDEYEIVSSKDGQYISFNGFGTIFEPGKPRLPSRIHAFCIPPSAIVTGLEVISLESSILQGRYSIAPIPIPRIISDRDGRSSPEELQKYELNRTEIYGSNEPYPQKIGEFIRTAKFRKYNLVDVRITPFSYRPESGRVTFHNKIEVTIYYKLDLRKSDGILDRLPRMERTASEIIYNYEDAQRWYDKSTRENGVEQHPLVIITLDSLIDAIAPLANWELMKANNPKVVTTSWITSNYSGIDEAEQIRNFLIDKYPSSEWGIENVLIIGHHTDIPMRLMWQRISAEYGRPLTDFYFAELSYPDSQSWDSDGDGRYGEGQDSMDFYSEVNIGRIPWSDFNTVQSICEKTVLYDQNNNFFFKNSILLLGAYFWDDTDNAVLMETKSNQPWMANWIKVKMYEKNAAYTSSYSCDYPLLRTNVRNQWSNGMFAFVNWAGHGSPTSSHILGINKPAFITASDCSILNDNFPAIIFADACSNSDTDYVNIGQAMMKQGAVGFVGATKVAYGCPGWSHPDSGSTQSLDYYFTKDVTSGDYKQGESHQRALRHMYTNGLWYLPAYEMAEWTLWGNPCLGMRPPRIPDLPTVSVNVLLSIVLLFSLILYKLQRNKTQNNVVGIGRND